MSENGYGSCIEIDTCLYSCLHAFIRSLVHSDDTTRRPATNKNEIQLPSYWIGLIDYETITVKLTSIGSHQNIIVKRWDENKVY